ncbi:MAG: TIM barrel protein [Pirellulales bacterium]
MRTRVVLRWFATEIALIVMLQATCLIASAQPAVQNGREHLYKFFAFDNGVGRDQNWTPQQQAQLLAELGFDGIGYSGVQNLRDRYRVFDAAGLRIYSLYIDCWPAREQPFDPPLRKEDLAFFAGRDVTLWIVINGVTNDEQAASVLRELADEVNKHRVRLAIYPHFGCYVATARHALKIVKLVDRKNVGMSLNLCHELRAGNADELSRIVEESIDHLFLVSIHGADRVTDGNREQDWSRLIKPLDEGEFNVVGFLEHLSKSRYSGPIGLQCFGLSGDTRTLLQRSKKAWDDMR